MKTRLFCDALFKGVLSLMTISASAQSPPGDAALCEEGSGTLTLPVLGSTFVCMKSGTWYAMSSALSSKNVLPAIAVSWAGDKVIVPAERSDELTWTISKSNSRITTKAGKYLGHGSSTNIAFFDNVTKNDCEWKWNSDDRYWQHVCSSSTTIRTMLYSTEAKGFKLYAASYLGGTLYADSYASYVQMIPGYVRSVTAGNYGTLCLPYDAVPADGLLAEFRGIAGKVLGEDGQASELILSEPVSELIAGTPYVFRSEADYISLAYSGDCVMTASEVNGLVGVFDGINLDQDKADGQLSDCYVLSDNELCRCADGSSLGANRAYIRLEDVPVMVPEEGAVVLRFQGSVPTSVSMRQELRTQKDVIYSLSGVRWKETTASSLQPGIYIINGHVQVLH